MGSIPRATSSPTSVPAAVADISAETLVGLRADMLRFAQLQLRHAESAEDLVQESIEAALRHAFHPTPDGSS